MPSHSNVSLISTPTDQSQVLAEEVARFLTRYGCLADTHANDAFSLGLLEQLTRACHSTNPQCELLAAAGSALDDLARWAWSAAVNDEQSPQCTDSYGGLATTVGGDDHKGHRMSALSSSLIPTQYNKIIQAEEVLRQFVVSTYYDNNNNNNNTTTQNSNRKADGLANGGSESEERRAPMSSTCSNKVYGALHNKSDPPTSSSSSHPTNPAAVGLSALLATVRDLRMRIEAAFGDIEEGKGGVVELDRQTEEKNAAACNAERNNSSYNEAHSASPYVLASSSFSMPSSRSEDLAKVYEKSFHMNPKKIYEVATMAPFIHREVQKTIALERERRTFKKEEEHSVSKEEIKTDRLAFVDESEGQGKKMMESVAEEPLTVLVDIGAGQGYLSAALCLPPYNYTVIAVEREGNNCHGSLKSSRAVQRILADQQTTKGKSSSSFQNNEGLALGKKKEKANKNENNTKANLVGGEGSFLSEVYEDKVPIGCKRNREEASIDKGGKGEKKTVELAFRAKSEVYVPTERKGCLLVAKLEVNEETTAESLLKMVRAAVEEGTIKSNDADNSEVSTSEQQNKDHSESRLVSSSQQQQQRVVPPLRIVFISLHACGGLSHQMLRLFNECNAYLSFAGGRDIDEATSRGSDEGNDSAKLSSPSREGGHYYNKKHISLLPKGSFAPLLVNVGCCYNLIDDNDDVNDILEGQTSANADAEGGEQGQRGTEGGSFSTNSNDDGVDQKPKFSTFPLSSAFRKTFSSGSARTVTIGRDGTVPLPPLNPLHSPSSSLAAPTTAILLSNSVPETEANSTINPTNPPPSSEQRASQGHATDKVLVLTKNLRQAACQCPARWGRRACDYNYSLKSSSAVVNEEEKEEYSINSKEHKGNQKRREADKNEDERQKDVACRKDVLNTFENNFQRAVLQHILIDALLGRLSSAAPSLSSSALSSKDDDNANNGNRHNVSAVLDIDTKIIAKFIVRYKSLRSDQHNEKKATLKELKGERETAVLIVKSTQQTPSLFLCEKRVKASERDVGILYDDLRLQSAAEPLLPCPNIKNSNNDDDDKDQEDSVAQWQAKMQRMFVDDYALPSVTNLVNTSSLGEGGNQTTPTQPLLPEEARLNLMRGRLWEYYVRNTASACASSRDSVENPPPPPRVYLSALWALKALIGELIEKIILLDRCLFLREESYSGRSCRHYSNKISNDDANHFTSLRLPYNSSTVAQPLDPYLSPRCYAVVSRKL